MRTPAVLREGEWQLWAKTDGADETCAWHPLICHMVDVWAVATRLLDDRLPMALLRRFSESMGLSTDASRPWLAYLAALHDLGKASPPFQAKWRMRRTRLEALGYRFGLASTGPRHDIVTAEVLPSLLAVELGWPQRCTVSLARALGAHHGVFPSDADALEVGSSAGRGQWAEARRQLLAALRTTVGLGATPTPSQAFARDWAGQVLLAGLTTTADWLGSMAEHFTYANGPVDLDEYRDLALERAGQALRHVGWSATAPAGAIQPFVDLFDRTPWPLHTAVERVSHELGESSLILIEAPMGEGKTEAALFLAHALAARSGYDGFFVALPTQATSNQMFGRVRKYLEGRGRRANLQLAHGAAAMNAEYRELGTRSIHGWDGDDTVVAESWFAGKKRSLLSTFGVGTVDQALLGVMRSRHAHLRLFGLAGKVAILDEVHAYDTYTSELIDRLLAWLGAMGVSVVILSATLPNRRRVGLLSAYTGMATQVDTAPYPRITLATRRPGLAWVQTVESRRCSGAVHLRWLRPDLSELADSVARTVQAGGCVGWITNSVGRAQQAYEAIRRDAPEIEVHLLHSRLQLGDRLEREQAILSALGPEGRRPQRVLVIGTQVLEQSLDLDFDLVVTELAPVDLLLQRLGRLHRHERPRPPHLELPQAWVVSPEPDGETGPALTEIGAVYDPAVLLRTWYELRGRDHLILPDDIDMLVQRVYHADDLEDAPEGLRERLAQLTHRSERSREVEALMAAVREWPRPDARDDPFASLTMPYQTDDPEVAAALQAATRLADPSVDVVLLHTSDGAVRLDPMGVIVDMDHPPDATLTRELVLRSVRLGGPRLTASLLAARPPASWRRNGMLRHHRCLFLTEGQATVGDFSVILDKEQGVRVERNARNRS